MANSKELIDALILFQHAARELDVACAVKAIAEDQFNLRVEICHWRMGVRAFLARCSPRVVVLPFCYRKDDYDTLLLAWRKAVFFNLAWEQLLSSATEKAKSPKDEFTRTHVIHHAWGEFFSDYLVRNHVPREHVFVNGNPAYMLYREPYASQWPNRECLAAHYGLDPNRRWIFFPENYGWAFYSDAEVAEAGVSRGMTAQEAYGIRDYSRDCIRAAVDWCRKATEETDAEVIIRPRPAIPLLRFEQMVKEVLGVRPARLHLIKSGTVREWILASDKVVTSYSTSLIEAAIAGRHVALLEPRRFPEYLQVTWYDYVGRIRSSNEFVDFCSNDGEPQRALSDWAHAQMLRAGDPIWELASYLSRLVEGKAVTPPLPRRRLVTRSGSFEMPGWLRSILFEYRRLRWAANDWHENVPEEVYPIDEKDVVTSEELINRVRIWKSVLKDYSPATSIVSTFA